MNVSSTSHTPLQSNASNSDESRNRGDDADGGFGALMAAFEGMRGVSGLTVQAAGSVDMVTLTDQRAPTARAGRLAELRRADVEHRSGGPSRIAGAQIPHDQIVEEAAARERRLESGTTEHARTRNQASQPAPTQVSMLSTGDGRSGEPPPRQASRDVIDSRRDASREPARSARTAQAARPATLPPAGVPGDQSLAGPRPVAQPSATAAKPPNDGRVSPSGSRGGVRVVVTPASGAVALARAASDRKTDAYEAMRKRFDRASKQHGAKESPQRAAFDRVARIVRQSGHRNETVARIDLDPAELGHVRVHLRMKNDVLRVRLTAATADARDVLMSQSGELRAAMEQQGVRVERMDFSAPQQDGQGLSHGAPDDSDGGSASHAGARERSSHGDVASDDAIGGDLSGIERDGGDEFDDGSAERVLAELRLDVRV